MNTIYIGASNRKLGLTQYRLYKERPTELIETLKAKIPLIERLFISVEELRVAELELMRSETLTYKAWKQSKEAK